MTFLRDKWLWETTCIIFSIACVIAITILSSRLDGTWVSKWSFFLQPSTTFSILITAAQSSMMFVIAEVLSQLKWLQMSLPKAQPVADFATFDSASRGPLGSLKLFYSWKPESNILPPMVYAASLITIAALAMGPFTQQVISVQADNLVPRDGVTSTIAVTNYYNYGPADSGPMFFLYENGTIGSNPSMTDAMVLDVDPVVQGGFYDGYYNLDESFIDFSCPSSNCSWEIFNSLGICSTCRDVTETTQVVDHIPYHIFGEPIYRYTIRSPGGWSFVLNLDDKVATAANYSIIGSTLDTFSANLVSMVVVQKGSRSPSPMTDYITTECSISWCAKQYSNVTIVRLSLILSRQSSGIN